MAWNFSLSTASSPNWSWKKNNQITFLVSHEVDLGYFVGRGSGPRVHRV